jgi:light-regulated signal transduction histidine kinase (bacteriophytochrome)
MRNQRPLNSLVEDVLKELKPEIDGRQIVWHIGSLPVVNCEPGLLQQACTNLLSNAVKYTRRREHAVIEVDQMTIDGEVAIYVRDYGAGFDSKYTGMLFGAFRRLHTAEEFEGAGVGLATVQRIIRKHGGRIWTEAERERRYFLFHSQRKTMTERPIIRRRKSSTQSSSSRHQSSLRYDCTEHVVFTVPHRRLKLIISDDNPVHRVRHRSPDWNRLVS